VAHEAAANGTLPAGFDRWEIDDWAGWTVAQAAAEHGKLPAGFDRWELVR